MQQQQQRLYGGKNDDEFVFLPTKAYTSCMQPAQPNKQTSFIFKIRAYLSSWLGGFTLFFHFPKYPMQSSSDRQAKPKLKAAEAGRQLCFHFISLSSFAAHMYLILLFKAVHHLYIQTVCYLKISDINKLYFYYFNKIFG